MTLFALLVGLARAAAPEGTVVVPVGGLGAGERDVVATQLPAGSTVGAWVPADALAARVKLVSVVDRADDADCGGAVELERWRLGVAEASRLLQVLDLQAALAAFVARELEMACLATAPANADLLQVELGLATAHRYLALEVRTDEARRHFHEAEAARALARAVALGRGLALPADTDPELAADWSAAQETPARGTLLVLAPAGVGVRIDGRPVGTEVQHLLPGTHLVQAVDGPRVTAADLLTLPAEGAVLVWVEPGGRGPGPAALVDAVAGIGSGTPDPDALRLLAGAGTLLGAGAPVWFVAPGAGGPVVWALDGAGVRRAAAPEPAPGVIAPGRPRSPWSGRVGLGGGGTTLAGGVREGLGGVGPTVHLAVTRDLGRSWSLGLSVRPVVVGRRLPPWDGGGVLFRATLPVLAEAGWHLDRGPWRVDAGLALGPHLLGPFETFEVEALLLARVGVTRDLDGRGWYTEAWGGPGTGYGAVGVSLGFTWRR